MSERSDKHTFSENLNVRKRQIEAELANMPDAATRERLMQQIKEIEFARNIEGWLRSTDLRPPK